MPTKKTATTIPSRLYPNDTGFTPDKSIEVGGVILQKDDLEYNAERRCISLTVRNTGDRPIQVGSHFHFFEVNRYLDFDRSKAFGCHLNIPATTAIRFEPGDSREVELVTYAGKRRIIGFNSLVEGYTGDEDSPTYTPAYSRAMHDMCHAGFKHTPCTADKECTAKDQKDKCTTNNKA